MRLSLPAFLVACALGVPALAQDETPTKRGEGRYFVELTEIMLTPRDFDRIMATVDPDGPAGPAAKEDVEAVLSDPLLGAPRVTIGLNRPSGKTSFSLSYQDFDPNTGSLPQDLEVPDQVVTSPFLPPGIVFQRQHPGPPGFPAPTRVDDDFVPNWGEEWGYVRRLTFKTTQAAVQHNIFENKRLRLRWIGGLRHASLDEKTSTGMVFHGEGVFGTFKTYDFFRMQSKTSTHGIGPDVGLSLRGLVGKKKKWSFDGSADVTLIPESTTASYSLDLSDQSAEQNCIDLDPDPDPLRVAIACTNNGERPAMPGLPVNAGGQIIVSGGSVVDTSAEFFAFIQQQDFTEITWLAQAQLGFRYKVNDTFTLGLDWWGMSWLNLLSEPGIVDTVNEQATYEQFRPSNNSTDPALREFESVIHVPRFSERHDVSFDGFALNLKFEF